MFVFFAQAITSFVASAGFAILFNAPRRALIQCGIVGMCGWLLYYYLVNSFLMDVVPSTVIAAILVGILSRICAVYYKKPIIIFYVAGIIPLVPGGIAYNAMRNFVENDYLTGVQLSAKVVLLSGGIALGLMFSEVANKILAKTSKQSL